MNFILREGSTLRNALISKHSILAKSARKRKGYGNIRFRPLSAATWFDPKALFM